MNNRQRVQAILHYETYDRMPVVHFGYWRETLAKWAKEGYISQEIAENWGDGNKVDNELSAQIGFDFDWSTCFSLGTRLRPGFESKVIKEFPDGSKHYLDGNGVVILQKPDAISIPSEIAHTLVDRASWEEHYKWRFEFTEKRITDSIVRIPDDYETPAGADAEIVAQGYLPFTQGGKAFLQKGERDYPLGLFCGSLYGQIRDILGVEGSCYLMMDDEELFDEIIDTVGEMTFRCVDYALQQGIQVDFGHFWEDICYKNGPLISPSVFEAKVGPHYQRITDLLKEHGVDIVSLDCDGMIDSLLPTWFNHGVNTMFPIEVGTWNASIAPWREQYGKELRGVGGMNKVVLARDKSAVDAEIERLKPLVDLGGYIPCPDHRIAPDAHYGLVCYYCEKMHKVFG